MKTLTAKQLALFNSGDTRIDAYPAERVRVRVQGPTGAFFDVTTYGGNDFLNSVQWGEDIDSPHATASISLRREIEQFSMSPLVVHSAYNHGFVPSAAYAAFLALGREVYIEVAITAMDVDPVAADWFPVFYGVIDSIDPGGDSEIVLSCRDLAGKIADTFIDTERVYAFAAQALRVWAPNTIYAANEYILPATRGQNTDTNGTTVDDPGRGKYYKCTTGGTSGTTEPVWPGSSTIASGTCVFTYEGTTTTAGVAVETVMQQILGDNGLSSTFTLDVPTSPSWNISQFIQQRQPVLEAIRNLAIQIGWDVRFVWKAATSAFVLRLYKPDRAKATVDRTFNNRSWSRITQFATEISGIRNVVRVLYSDPADLWTDGTPKRKSVEVPAGRTSTSITAYGIRFAEIAEDSASQIDTSTEALLMANAALSDLQTPIAAVGLELVSAFPWVELGDRYTLAAGVTPGYALNQIFSADQTLAIYGYSHSASDGAIRTSFKLRGQPALGFDRWEAVSARIKPTHKQTITQSKSGFSNTILPLVGGARLQIAGDIDKGAIPSEVAVHVSASGATFTPSSSTLVAVTRAKTVEIGQLIPGAQYYVRTVQRGLNEGKLVESEPSKAISFIAGTAQAGHVNPHIDTSKKPLNGGFETFQANRFLPDQWRWYFAGAIYPDTTAPGAYTGKIDVIEDGNGISGKRYIKITSQSDYPQNLISG